MFIRAGPDKGAHDHELFLRGKRHLAHRIPRMKIKGQGARKPAQPNQEPNFYDLPYLPHATMASPQPLSPLLQSVVPTALPASYARMQQKNAADAKSNHKDKEAQDPVAALGVWWRASSSQQQQPPLVQQFPPATSLDQVLLQRQAALLLRNNYSPNTLSTMMVQEQANAVALLQQLRR